MVQDPDPHLDLDPDPHLDLDPDPHLEKHLDPDPQKMNADPQPCPKQLKKHPLSKFSLLPKIIEKSGTFKLNTILLLMLISGQVSLWSDPKEKSDQPSSTGRPIRRQDATQGSIM